MDIITDRDRNELGAHMEEAPFPPPICLFESEIVTEASLWQLRKAYLPMVTIPCTSATSTSKLESLKTESAMAVTLPQAERHRLTGSVRGPKRN